MKTDLKLKKVFSILIIIMLICFFQVNNYSQDNRKDKPQTLTEEQTTQLKSILSSYNASTLTAADAKAIHEKFRKAGIHPGPETKDVIVAAGFDPEKLRTLDPPNMENEREGQNPPSVEERLKMIEEKICLPLSLNNKQKEGLNAAFKEFFAEMEKQHEVKEKVRDEKIKQLLSKEQFTQYLELEKSIRPPKNMKIDSH